MDFNSQIKMANKLKCFKNETNQQKKVNEINYSNI